MWSWKRKNRVVGSTGVLFKISQGENGPGEDKAGQTPQSSKTVGQDEGVHWDRKGWVGPRGAERSESVTAAPWAAYQMPSPRAYGACCPFHVRLPFQQAVLETQAITESEETKGPTWSRPMEEKTWIQIISCWHNGSVFSPHIPWANTLSSPSSTSCHALFL